MRNRNDSGQSASVHVSCRVCCAIQAAVGADVRPAVFEIAGVDCQALRDHLWKEHRISGVDPMSDGRRQADRVMKKRKLKLMTVMSTPLMRVVYLWNHLPDQMLQFMR